MPWVLRGLRDGVVTSGYPRRRDRYADEFPGAVQITDDPGVIHPDAGAVCPTGAIRVANGRPTLDRGRCILCGWCVRAFPQTFAWAPGSETAVERTSALVVPAGLAESDEALALVRADLARRVRRFQRSVHLRHVDAGSDGAEEWEIQALTNPVYDLHRLGIFFTASPRHADLLLVTGSGARGMFGPLRRTQIAIPNPLAIIAVGTDAITGGLVSPSYATSGGLLAELDVDVVVPGSPPTPFAILFGILLALGRAKPRMLPTPPSVAVAEASR